MKVCVVLEETDLKDLYLAFNNDVRTPFTLDDLSYAMTNYSDPEFIKEALYTEEEIVDIVSKMEAFTKTISNYLDGMNIPSFKLGKLSGFYDFIIIFLE